MKTMLKKHGAYSALVVALFIMAVLVTSCVNPMDPSNLGVPKGSGPYGNTPVEAGKSHIWLNFGNARTIMPDTPIVGDLYYRVNITHISETQINEGPWTHAQITTTPITLTLGESYNITVNAYGDGDSGAVGPIVGSWNNPALVANTANTPVSVVLAPERAGAGLGTFTWNLEYDGSNDFSMLTTRNMEVFPFVQNMTGAATLTIDLNDDPDDSEEIASGPYHVRVTLAGTGLQQEVLVSILHVYRGLESVYQENFTALNPNIFTVTFNYNNASDGTVVTTTDQVSHYGLVTEPPSNPSGVTMAGFGIEEWREGSTSGTPWNFTTSRVFAATTLFAHWVETTVNMGFTITYAQIIDAAFNLTTSGPGNISQTDVLAGSVQFTITNADSIVGLDSITWSMAGKTPFVSNAPNLESQPFTLDAADIGALPRGPKGISVVFVIDGLPYSKQFTFNVVQ